MYGQEKYLLLQKKQKNKQQKKNKLLSQTLEGDL